jgi:hypothetical protein
MICTLHSNDQMTSRFLHGLQFLLFHTFLALQDCLLEAQMGREFYKQVFNVKMSAHQT